MALAISASLILAPALPPPKGWLAFTALTLVFGEKGMVRDPNPFPSGL